MRKRCDRNIGLSMRKIFNILFILLVALGLFGGSVHAKQVVNQPLKVLCIGNSFSIDAVEQNLVELAAERGVKRGKYKLSLFILIGS